MSFYKKMTKEYKSYLFINLILDISLILIKKFLIVTIKIFLMVTPFSVKNF